MFIRIDFWGTCLPLGTSYKEIGAAPVLKSLIANGHKLILMGGGTEMTNQWLRKHKIETLKQAMAPTDLYLTHKALGVPLISNKKISDQPYVDWSEVNDILKIHKIIK